MTEQELLQKLAELEHKQWMSWAKKILETENISSETRNRWEHYFVPYSDLPQDVKNLDGYFAQKSFELFQKYQKENK